MAFFDIPDDNSTVESLVFPKTDNNVDKRQSSSIEVSAAKEHVNKSFHSNFRLFSAMFSGMYHFLVQIIPAKFIQFFEKNSSLWDALLFPHYRNYI